MATQKDIFLSLRSALGAENARDSVREVVKRQLTSGADRNEVIATLEALRADLRQAGREEEEDVVLEVLDFVTGWCSPQMRL